MALICAIDPGFTGAIAFLNTGTRALSVHDMPTAPSLKGRVELDLYGLCSLLDFHGSPDEPRISVLEQVAARPGQGAPATFRFGQGYGAIEMALVGNGWTRNYVTPTVWKKHFKLSKDKGVSRALACQRFPQHADLFARVKDDGRAEAVLLALYALEVLLPKQGISG